jgi:hypothetical protein
VMSAMHAVEHADRDEQSATRPAREVVHDAHEGRG